MTATAYIKLVPSSETEHITIEMIKDYFQYFKEITSKTGTQLNWSYNEAAFPYSIKEHPASENKWFYLQSDTEQYNLIMLGIDKEIVHEDNGTERIQMYIQVTLPETSTFGDKGKANEFCRFLAKKLKGELHLFNGRIMYFYPRK
ncbi:DUF1885 family protein [Cytobacillus purgationiresistens]|uniref:DUF1885 family protein n=1 Tax=Cytobacillus purgationiresistens TaxID=863449 RepID=A0ABU0ANX8_9BACI|nr:DUF1885 family protein [Cytobacillus purgationiresistens]MDQ0272436.1 hypothetical protein [Cytobacillus purgationiresistens]